MAAGAALILVAPYAIAATSTRVVSRLDVPDLVSSPRLLEAVDVARRLGGPDLSVTVTTGEGPRSKVIPAASIGVRMLVLAGSEGRPSHRLLTARADLTLAVRVGRPTVSVPVSWEPSTARGVAVGIDGTELSVEALDFAFQAAAARAVPLLVIHAGGDRGPQAERILAEALAGRADEYPDVDVRRLVSTQSATTTLLTESRTAELLVVGARSTALAAVNPVVRRVVASSRCPVAVVPHPVSSAERDRVRRRTRESDPAVNILY
ncbi:hypothetical protein E1263_07280 [Kribbella antibiotica]|uniref:UspA domain-containing protein n=1 Tax=Kribbella antibiotica TaxID=190195 RepID=A0A4R4ZRT8_9ACTN|nr:universal stress protein [Kribbella antibiotica]TDD61495.1 hypothetical protein E1263_07280 [Kribbella antibiotica]